jgi:hypothetical protein
MLAALETEKIGAPFSRHVIAHWERAGITDAQAAQPTGRLTKLMADWARRRGGRILWSGAREKDAGKGSHLHMLVACPCHLPLGRMWRRWLRSITGQPYRPGSIRTRFIGGSLDAARTNPGHYRQHLFNAVAYVCKGIHPDDAGALGIERTEPGGQSSASVRPFASRSWR